MPSSSHPVGMINRLATPRMHCAAVSAVLIFFYIGQEPAAGQERQRPDAGRSASGQRGDNPNRDHWQVPGLPADNLLKNPWFRQKLEPWISDGHWQGDTTKWGNPAPDDEAGTAARISTGRRADSDVGKTVDIGKDAYLFQVVPANPANRTLRFDMYWVAHTVDPGEVNVYGGPSATGPWTHLWRPFHQVHLKAVRPPEGRSGNLLWRHYSNLTDLVTTTLPVGHPYFKIEVRGNLPDRSGGFKITGIYFSATSESSPAPGKGQ